MASISSKSIEWIDIEVPIIICELIKDEWKTKRTKKTIQIISTSEGSEAKKILAEFEELPKISTQQCKDKNKELVLGVPETWVIRPGSNVPQIIISLAEKRNPEGKIQPSGYRTLTIPHPNFRALQLQNLVIKPQIRGEHYAEAVLKDNSKMRVYLDSEAKAMAYMKNLLTSYVDQKSMKDEG